MRIRGGTNGLLSAMDAGLVDPENAGLPEEVKDRGKLKGSDLRRNINRDNERARFLAKRAKKGRQ